MVSNSRTKIRSTSISCNLEMKPRSLLSPQYRRSQTRTQFPPLTSELHRSKYNCGRPMEYGARFVIVIGIMEAKKLICQLKDMDKWTQIEVPLGEVIERVISEVGTENLSILSSFSRLYHHWWSNRWRQIQSDDARLGIESSCIL